MALLRHVFGPSKDEIWSQIATDIGGIYEEGGFLGTDTLQYKSGEWLISLDTITESSGNTIGPGDGHHQSHTQVHTRMRAPFINKDSLQFKIYRESIFSPIGKMLGFQDVIIGDPLFDDSFIIKSNNEEKIKQLLNDDSLKSLITKVPDICFEIADDDGFFADDFPDGVDQLLFTYDGEIRDKTLIRDLFDLFTCTLERLVQIDSAYEDDPGIQL
ncbi:MAG: DUF3137 domain-containing protein [Lentisphaeria bacterium]|nr:DUF3137 domain-containing protein [Lentisphaeria bacterium]NQZ66803.1 DUF3137 domain-containing protein [Lentisphaeria bacterium]